MKKVVCGAKIIFLSVMVCFVASTLIAYPPRKNNDENDDIELEILGKSEAVDEEENGRIIDNDDVYLKMLTPGSVFHWGVLYWLLHNPPHRETKKQDM